jgi:glycosyltransferase involved in cell wall biosynthesis
MGGRPRVAIDLLASLSGGALNYVRNLLPIFAARGRFAYALVLRRSQAARLGDALRGFETLFAPEQTVSPLPRLAWGQAVLPILLRARRIDLLFAPTDHPPLLPACPVVMAVRNPTPYTEVRTVEGVGRRARERVMRAWTRAAAQKARRVIFVSRAAADVINAHLRVPSERVRVIHHGLDRVIARGVEAPLPTDVPSDYVLAVSSFYRYKNYLGLVRALELVRERHGAALPLVICGREIDRPNVEAVRAAAAKSGLPVQLRGERPPEELSVLYRGARVFCFPSYLETFGHPLVESMASGTPIVAADIPTSRELCGSAARYVDPHDEGAIAEALWTLWNDGDERRRLRALGQARARDFSWEKTADETEAALAEALV